MLRALLCFVCAFTLSGCYRYHAYQVGGPEGREEGNQPATEWKGATRHSLFWGLIRQDLPIENCRTLDGKKRLNIEEFKVESNFLYTLATLGTLGIWAPVEIQWRCAKPQPRTGGLDD